jgi:hypothetical protein
MPRLSWDLNLAVRLIGEIRLFKFKQLLFDENPAAKGNRPLRVLYRK